MSELIHPKAVHNLPMFITEPGGTDVLMVIMAWFLLFCILGFGVFYFRLHSLPEHIAHKADKVQMEIVAVLGLISLFTHEHIYWIAALILAFIDLPDFGTPLRRIAGSVGKIAGDEPPQAEHRVAAEPAVHPDPGGPPVEIKKPKPGDSAATKKHAAPTSQKEPSHA